MARTAKNTISILNGGIAIGEAGSIDFTGTGVNVSAIGSLITVNIPGGSSGSYTILSATGTIDDSNTSFTFADTPTVIVINGASYNAGAQVGGVAAWTIVGLTVTLAFPVGTGGSIWGAKS